MGYFSSHQIPCNIRTIFLENNYMNRIVSSFAAILIFTLTPFTSLFAWNALGHMVIANVAYQNLKPAVRQKVDNLTTYFQKEYPETNAFVEISYWPDAIRSQKIESFTHWHYINYPFSFDGTRVKTEMDTDNAIWAFGNIKNVIKNERANVYERVRFLAFLVHITGDLHQPLHTIEFYSAAHPDGDKGGNLYYVRYQNQRTKLHKIWDEGMGNLNDDKTIGHAKEVSNAIMALYPAKYFGDKVNDLNPNNWAKEGMTNAKDFIYTIPENQAVTPGYIDAGKKLAQQQLALAGYRLGNLLNQLLD